MFEFAGEQYLPARPGPAHMPGVSWDEYYRDVAPRGGVVAPDPVSTDDPAQPVEDSHITVPAHEIEEGWPDTLATWRKRAIAGGWEFKMGHAQSEVEPTYYVDRTKGILYQGWTSDIYWMNAVRGDDYITISYRYKNGVSHSLSRQSRKFWYRKWSDADMREYMK